MGCLIDARLWYAIVSGKDSRFVEKRCIILFLKGGVVPNLWGCRHPDAALNLPGPHTVRAENHLAGATPISFRLSEVQAVSHAIGPNPEDWKTPAMGSFNVTVIKAKVGVLPFL